MTEALAYEIRRIRTLRSTWIMVALVALSGAGIAYLSVRLRADDTGADQVGGIPLGSILTAYTSLGVVFLAVIGAQAIGQEYRYGLIRLTLTSIPRRTRALTAKVAVLSGFVVATAVVASFACIAGAWAGRWTGGATPILDGGSADAGVVLRGVLYVVLYALVAFAIAGITRNLPLGIIIPLVTMAIVEPLLPVLTQQEWLVDVLPFVNGVSALSAEPSAWRGLAVFAAWVLPLLAVQAWLFHRRDA